MKGNCCKCGVYRKTIHKDHIIPKWQGGTDAAENMQLLCANCHEDKTWEEMHSIEFHAKMSIIMTGRNLGRKFSAEACAHIAAAARGRKCSEETRAKISAAKMGYKASEETRAKLSAALKGNKRTLGKNIGNKCALGYKYTAEQRAKMSASRIGHIVSKETKAKIGAATLGHKHTSETKAMLSAIRKAWWAKKKQETA